MAREREWPQEIGSREPVYGNFRPSRTERATRKKPDKKRQIAGMSDVHLDMLRGFPCLIPGCTQREIEAHHLCSGPAAKERGLGLKARDWHALPLCRWVHHADVHRYGSRREPMWFLDFGFEDPWRIARAMFDAATDDEALKIMIEGQRDAVRYMAELRRKQITLSRDEWRRL